MQTDTRVYGESRRFLCRLLVLIVLLDNKLCVLVDTAILNFTRPYLRGIYLRRMAGVDEHRCVSSPLHVSLAQQRSSMIYNHCTNASPLARVDVTQLQAVPTQLSAGAERTHLQLARTATRSPFSRSLGWLHASRPMLGRSLISPRWAWIQDRMRIASHRLSGLSCGRVCPVLSSAVCLVLVSTPSLAAIDPFFPHGRPPQPDLSPDWIERGHPLLLLFDAPLATP